MICRTIHIAMVCAGYNSTFNVVTTVKSIVFYRSVPLHFHFLVDEISKRTLKVLFDTWNIPNVYHTYYKIENWVHQVSWIPNKHYSGVYGLLKLVLPEIIHESKIIVLDADLTVLNDISLLWKRFNYFNENQLLGLVENQSNWYRKSVSYQNRPWPALNNGYNSGVMLMHLQSLRKKNFTHLWETVAKKVLVTLSETSLADQDIINSVIKEFPNIVYTIDCTWNIQLSDHTLSEVCYLNNNKLNIIHWNSPKKQKVGNKQIEEFRKLHQVFLELDGNLLRRKLLNCKHEPPLINRSRTNLCHEFRKGANLTYRTHLFLMEYEYNFFSPFDIVLATQCSASRITFLEEIAKNWAGSISVALYLTDNEVQSFLRFVQSSESLRTRRNIAYHIVYKHGEFYPVNHLRNVAMSYISTPYTFQMDIDFIPHIGLFETLIKYIQKFNVSQTSKIAIVVPAFETQRYRFTFPENKEKLISDFNKGLLYTFRYHVWSQGHAATNYSFWRKASEPYEVLWQPDYEPYVVVPSSAPKYDTRFIGFGWNKVSHVTHLTAIGYKYVVLPDTFIIHRPHAPSQDIAKFRASFIYRRCLKELKDRFVTELIEKYGSNATYNLKMLIKL
ncbi:LARGE xylosyl- and glucuronyltransferase 2-like isoform X2 [Leptopilina heterotoma]|uniref:LARGE xylosyl- and glucuronyltransferase 2-like isoform X2 n=1 Tax=Leptopilina heterotoma TaxID=63436 RepID=UPI001CAA0920|nr:LARGE xylosyl- and glucuronyltransferase 2-like isoform X2 [Leptopilina heterotoma]